MADASGAIDAAVEAGGGTVTEYGAVVVTRNSPLVEQAPEKALCHLGVIRDSYYFFLQGTDVLHIGHDRDDCPVYYRVTGWDAEQRALVIERCDERGDLLARGSVAGKPDTQGGQA